MPLVNAESDESFVGEVADEVRATCTRMNEHVSAMIEEYLRRRVEQVRQEVQQECDAQLDQMRLKITIAEGARATEESRYASLKLRLSDTAEALQQKDAKVRMQGFFLSWRCGAERRRERRRLAEEADRHRERLAAFQCYSQWRLFAGARRSAYLEAQELHKRDCREQELLGQLDVFQKLLRDEQEKNLKLNEDLKEAFVRGMCALNREAVQVLHGADESQEDDVEAIADILSRDTHSRRLSTPQVKAEDSTRSTTQHQSICPVHQVDRSGHFYHRCFAPGHCEYTQYRPHSCSPPSSNVSPAPPSPFVVRADPRAVRSFNAGSAVPARTASSSSQTRWKL